MMDDCADAIAAAARGAFGGGAAAASLLAIVGGGGGGACARRRPRLPQRRRRRRRGGARASECDGGDGQPQSLAGSIAHRLKGLAVAAAPAPPTKAPPPTLTATASTMRAVSEATSLRASERRAERPSMVEASYAATTSSSSGDLWPQPPPPPPPPPLAPPTDGSLADTGGGTDPAAPSAHATATAAAAFSEAPPLSVFDVLLRLLLLLAEAPPGTMTAPGDEAGRDRMRVMVSQRLRELLWRDSQQGCRWAHLSSGGGDDDDSHWDVRRGHVFRVLAALGVPLRRHAEGLRDAGGGGGGGGGGDSGGGAYDARLCETLVPLMQGVLRTYRHFLALEIAPSASDKGAASSAGYGQRTVLIGQLGGVETPAWMGPATPPEAFVRGALPQWGPLLDAPPLAAARQLALHADDARRDGGPGAGACWAAAAAAGRAGARGGGRGARLHRRLQGGGGARGDAEPLRRRGGARRAHVAQVRSLLREQAVGGAGVLRRALLKHSRWRTRGGGGRCWCRTRRRRPPEPRCRRHRADAPRAV